MEKQPRTRKLLVASSLTLMIVTAGSLVGMITPVHAILSSASAANPSGSVQDTYSKNLVVYLTLSGLNDTVGQVYGFVNAHGKIQATAFNASQLKTINGVGQTAFVLSNLALKPGDQFTTCVVVPSYVKMICQTDNKSPFSRPQYVDISLK